MDATVAALAAALALAGYCAGAYRAERETRRAHAEFVRATLAELVDTAIAKRLDRLELDIGVQVERALNDWLGFARQPADTQIPQPVPPVEERAALAITEQSFEAIREGLMGEYGLAGKQLDEALAEVRRQFESAGEIA